MTNPMPDPRESPPSAARTVPPRRRFLVRLGTLAGGLLVALGIWGPLGGLLRGPVRSEAGPEAPRPHGPLERPLAEADLYAPHRLAG